MNGQGVRPNKLWHWAAIAFLTATFLAEPRAFMALTWELFRGAGAIGGELLTGEPEPDVLDLEPTDTIPPGSNGPDAGADDGAGGSGGTLGSKPGPDSTDSSDAFDTARPTLELDGDGLRSILDSGVTAVVALHDQVEEIQTAGGFSIDVGDQP